MDNYSYLCQHCGKNYIPKRRVVQKYCSNSCRTKAYQLRNPKSVLGLAISKGEEPTKIDKMSFAGVGNAAAGTLAVNALTSLFTSEANKPATKNDLRNLEAKILKRYYPVKNWPPNNFGKKPYFDIEQSCIIYF
jgi:hypothetical protein